MRRPTLKKGPAAQYAAANEIIREFHNGKAGGLISLRTRPDGNLAVAVYNCDPGVTVSGPARPPSVAVYKEHVDSLPLADALWWFIENIGDDDDSREGWFFYLRARRQREEG